MHRIKLSSFIGNHRLFLLSTMMFLVRFPLSRSIVIPSSSHPHQARRRQRSLHIGVIGGGASGIFAGIAAAASSANNYSDVVVTVLEATRRPLQKVKLSGGGRCNVLHDSSKPLSTILQGYPRGSKELRGLYTKQFGPVQARAWFEDRGIALKTEADGRMFPTTDSSMTIVNCLLEAAQDAGVNVQLGSKVAAMSVTPEGQFQVTVQHRAAKEADESSANVRRSEPSALTARTLLFDSVIVATGSAPMGYQLAASLGHTIVPTVASLFTLSCKHAVQVGGLLHGLSGLSVPVASIQLRIPDDDGATPAAKKNKSTVVQQQGPLLITHHGLSGPCALRLSAFAAREFAQRNYRAALQVHWAPHLGNTEQVFQQLWELTSSVHSKKLVSTLCPIPESNLPRRLWSALVEQAGIVSGSTTRWADMSKQQARALALQIAECHLEMTSKGAFKEEFVTAGGVDLKEMDLKTMQSKLCKGLFFCGEVNNVDGVTGGYNFMNCWGTGYVAGENAASYVSTLASAPRERQLSR
jgi:predicted Rossmann fold flavoprotein